MLASWVVISPEGRDSSASTTSVVQFAVFFCAVFAISRRRHPDKAFKVSVGNKIAHFFVAATTATGDGCRLCSSLNVCVMDKSTWHAGRFLELIALRI